MTKTDGSSKGNIVYRYDAQGTKWAKIVTDSSVSPVKVTTNLYIKGVEYKNDTIQFVSHEEGRTRYFWQHYVAGDSSFRQRFDFFEKDHLGNTRVILTDQRDTGVYMATMEAAYRAKERALFYNLDSCSYPVSSIPGYPADATTSPNDSVAKVNGSTRPMGLALLLKVMSGDSVTLVSKYFYKSSGASSGNQDQTTNIIASLAQGLVGMTGGMHGSTGTFTGSNSPVFQGVNDFITDYDATPVSKPKAYLNWMILDNQFKYDSATSGALPVTTPDLLGTMSKQIKLKKSGYLYIWISNETKGWDVFFDNLKVTHYVGPMLEENHYYPFGLTMAGISDKALKGWYPENKYRYNKGSELQNKEFSDGSGLEMYETPLRSLDPQLGRWWQIDSKPDYAMSLYASMDNNPILHNDPLGDVPGDYYNEKGEHIGNDGKDDHKVYVIRTTQTTTEMYGKDNYDQKGYSKPITQEAATQTEIKIKEGNFDASVAKNTVQIQPEKNMEKMVQAVSKDDGTGGTKPSNNREYSGNFTTKGVKENAPGTVGDPAKGKPAVSLGDNDYHSHPSGTKRVPGGRAEWIQPPSKQDIQTSTGTEYVVGMKNNTIYIYNKTGVLATIPINTFRP